MCTSTRERLREPSFMVSLAQINYYIKSNRYRVQMGFAGFKNGMNNFIKFIFKECFTTDCSFLENEGEMFEIKKDKLKRKYKSKLNSEAYKRKGKLLQAIIHPKFTETTTLLSIIGEFSYDDYLELKGNWLRNYSILWQICGHVIEDDARCLVQE